MSLADFVHNLDNKQIPMILAEAKWLRIGRDGYPSALALPHRKRNAYLFTP